jgi:DNA polymerase-4
MPLPRVILHIDMNSYFASVEQQANPFLRGRAIGVVATMSPNGCIIASSVEAKAKGIKTGFRVREARDIDPNIILIPNDAAKYRTVTGGILRILRSYTEDIELYSIDEAFLNLTGFVSSLEEAISIGERIRQRITAEVGEWLKCSIGIAPTRWLAKFGSDIAPKGKTLLLHLIHNLFQYIHKSNGAGDRHQPR